MTLGGTLQPVVRILLAILVAAAAFSAGAYFGQQPTPSLPRPEDAAIRELLQLELPDAEGASYSLRQWDGQWRIINYWASWCPPCRDEMPEFSRLQQEYAGKGVQFVGIALDSPGNVAAFSKAAPATYPLLIASPEAIRNLKHLGNPQGALPYTLIIDPQGKLRENRLGTLSATDIRPLLP